MRRCLALLLLTLAGAATHAQVAVSVRGAFLETWHQAQVRDGGGILDCGLLRSGKGAGWGIALGGDFPLWPLRLEVALQVSERGGTLTAQNTVPLRDTLSGSVIEVQTETRLRSTWLIAELQPALLFPFARRFQAFLGISVGLPVVARFRQEEVLLSPDTVFFVSADGQRWRSRLLAEGNFQKPVSPQLVLTAGLSHALSLGGTWEWTQRLGVSYALTSFLPGASWRPWSLRAEMGIRVRFEAPAPQVAPPATPSTPPTPPAVVSQSETPALSLLPAELTVRVRSGHELRATPPLVPAIFFDSASAHIPERYVQKSVNPEELALLDPLEMHRYVLPYVSWLVQRHAAARVVLEGATSGDEPGGIVLAERRAEAVRRALLALGVPAERITVRASLLPRSPSNPAYPEGRAENRRVDIVLQNTPSVEYIRRQKFRELIGEVAVRLECRGMAAGEAVEISSSCGDSLVVTPCREGQVVRLPLRCWLPEAGSFPVTLRASNAARGVAAETLLEILPDRYPHDTVELDVRRFRAILRFDYNSSELSPEVQERLRQLVKLLPPQARVIIYGSTDALGTERRNVELTEERARKTAQFLQSLSPTLSLRTLSLPPAWKFTEAVPEGRFLNRSIWLELEL